MALIKNGEIADDPWLRLADGDNIPAEQSVLVTLEHWQNEREALSAREAPVGIILSSEDHPSIIADDLTYFDLVALEFPTFRDGRAFSSARVLRDRYGFTGEVRAIGYILFDQLLFLHRAGFDAVEMSTDDSRAQADWQKALSEISIFYQDTHDGRDTILRRRHG
jgi:uncharacterized protein (DUF934 family)